MKLKKIGKLFFLEANGKIYESEDFEEIGALIEKFKKEGEILKKEKNGQLLIPMPLEVREELHDMAKERGLTDAAFARFILYEKMYKIKKGE